MSLTAMKPHRRLPRTNLECLVYINFEPHNGGIVLNISEEGLCFHAVTRVAVNTKASFWFSEAGSRIPAEGFVVWADNTGKTGGLRFDHLSPEARRQIRFWMDQSSKPPAGPKQVVAPMTKSPNGAPIANGAHVAASAVPRTFWKWTRKHSRWSEFLLGLATGLVFAVTVTALFSLHTRQRIGDALILLGERFEPKPQSRVAPSSSHWSTASAPELTVQTPMRVAPAVAIPVSSPSPNDEKPTTVAPRIDSKPAPTTTPAPAVPSASISSLPLLARAPAPLLVAPEGANLASPEKVLAAKAVDQPGENENAEDVLEINSGMPLGKYFEVGKFKDQLVANEKRHDLEELGFRTVVLPRSLLWMKSYQVLVGPYHNEPDAQRASGNLQAQGLKPRSLSKHSRQLTLVGLWMNPTDAAERDNLTVTWEAYSAEASVKLVGASHSGRAATGKWVKLPTKSDYTAITYTTGRTGTRTLLSIQFRGMNQAVTLANSADNSIVF